MIRAKAKAPSSKELGAMRNKSLTMTYFHTGCSTIIGAKSFHGPVRDGKGWYQLAIVIRHNLLICCVTLFCDGQQIQLGRSMTVLPSEIIGCDRSNLRLAHTIVILVVVTSLLFRKIVWLCQRFFSLQATKK